MPCPTAFLFYCRCIGVRVLVIGDLPIQMPATECDQDKRRTDLINIKFFNRSNWSSLFKVGEIIRIYLIYIQRPSNVPPFKVHLTIYQSNHVVHMRSSILLEVKHHSSSIIFCIRLSIFEWRYILFGTYSCIAFWSTTFQMYLFNMSIVTHKLS